MGLKRSYIVALTLVLFSIGTAHAQVPEIEPAFNQYQQKSLREKLFVHTDKSFYLTGDIIWFKLYDTDADSHIPLSISKVAYVEIIDRNQSPVMQVKIALYNGSGNGSVYIPVNLSNGNYKLRAYTNWMKNFAADAYFEKQIAIVNPLKSPESTDKQQPAIPYDVQLFTEGGTLLNGVENRLAYKITAINGKGGNLDGALINQRNDTLVRFKTQRFGIGSFVFTPVAGNSYKVVFNANKKAIIKSLPPVATQGYQMMVTDHGEQLNVKINSSQLAGTVYLFTHARKKIVNAQTAQLNQGNASFNLDRSKLAEGINHITVFDEVHRPVCERLYFKRPTSPLHISISADQATYNRRKKVILDYATENGSGKAWPANLSLAVYKIDSLQKPDDIEIQSYLWLASELRGNIESASYYFNNVNAETNKALDDLMLTQGWRQFNWDAVLNNKTPAFKFLPEYNGHLVTGKIFNADNTPAAGVVTYLSVPGKRVQLYAASSDSTGALIFNTRQMYGAGEIILQTNFKKDSTYHIEIASPFSEQYNAFNYPVLHIKNLPQQLLESYNIAMQVQNLYNGNRLRQYYNPQVDSSAFYFKPYKAYKLDDFTRFTTMEEVLREYVTEVNVVKPHNQYRLITLSQAGVLSTEPLIMVDGVPVFNTNKLIALDPLKVNKLEVVNSKYYYGPSFNDGIFSFVTYKGDLGGLELDPRAVVMDYEGLQLERKFYAPVYDTPAETGSHLPDFRNLLYWMPNAGTGASGKNKVSFYTSDQPGKYMVLIQGIADGGEAGSAAAVFDVK